MTTERSVRIGILVITLAACWFVARLRKRHRRRQFTRGRQLSRRRRSFLSRAEMKDSLRWGVLRIPQQEAPQHFLAVGTTGSGKSLLQRLLMCDVLRGIKPGTDRRSLIFDAKGDTASFLEQIGVDCPVYSLNPFQLPHPQVQPVAWDIAADITSPARALNLAASLIPSSPQESNRYFADAARQVLAGVVESFLRHTPGDWTFADLVLAAESRQNVDEVLHRDSAGRRVAENFLGEDRTAYQVFTTLASRMAYFRSVAALWRHAMHKVSLSNWTRQESVLMLGSNAKAQTALEAVNEIVFRVLVEEIDTQGDNDDRRTWIWIDEARLSGPLLKSSLLPYLCVKGRSRGVCLVLAFQDIDGFKEAAGERIAHEIIAQCSHKALLRLESHASSSWASGMIGGYETIHVMHSKPLTWGRGGSRNEQLARRETVLASQFGQIPVTSRKNGLTGYFISPRYGTLRGVVRPSVLGPVAPLEPTRPLEAPSLEQPQWLTPWSREDRHRLHLDGDNRPEVSSRRRRANGDSGNTLGTRQDPRGN